MKSTLAAVALLAGMMVLSPVTLADKGAIMGTLVKVDGNTYTMKDEKGAEKNYTATDKTKKRGGEAKPGATIELYLAKDGTTIEMVELIKK